MRAPLGADRVFDVFLAIGQDERTFTSSKYAIISLFIRYALCNYFVVGIQETKTRLRVTNIAPAAAGNMQELRGRVPKGVAFANDWMDAAELCAGCGQP